MRAPWLAVRSVGVLAVPLLLAGVTAGISPAGSAAATTAAGSASSFGISGLLDGVAVVSASSAWAVGYSGSPSSPKTLIVRWNGKTWTRVSSPAPGADSSLLAVAATSADSAWAVGYTTNSSGSSYKSLILQWNGKVWKRVPSPSPAGRPVLDDVAVVSATSAWATGFVDTGTGTGARSKPLILRWNGKTWTRAPSPSPEVNTSLSGVAAVSATGAWAVGAR